MTRNERDANAELFESVKARAPLLLPPEDRDEDPFALWVGLRNAIGITLACAVVVIGGCELLRRAVS